ncbi:MAG: SIMPL domain-containing protein [Gemmatimonadales bacterium]
MKLSICIFSIALLGIHVPATAQVVPSEPAVSATGRGEVKVKPTRAVIQFTVTGRGETAAVAATENAKLVASTMRALSSAGVKSDEITNPGYSVSPDYEFTVNGRKQNGFVATNSIRVEIQKIADVGKIIDAGLAGGASQVGSAQFLGDKMEELRRAALRLAVQAARDDAAAMAEAAGGSLGGLLSVTGSGSTGTMYREVSGGVALAAASAVPTSINSSDLTVAATATARWEFIPRK